jgi:hypothetical protein
MKILRHPPCCPSCTSYGKRVVVPTKQSSRRLTTFSARTSLWCLVRAGRLWSPGTSSPVVVVFFCIIPFERRRRGINVPLRSYQ